MNRGQETKATRALALSVGLNTALTVAQIVVGIASHSLAVAADAAHQFVDVIALTIAYFSLKASALPASPQPPAAILGHRVLWRFDSLSHK